MCFREYNILYCIILRHSRISQLGPVVWESGYACCAAALHGILDLLPLPNGAGTRLLNRRQPVLTDALIDSSTDI